MLLLEAATGGQGEAMKFLLKCGTDVNLCDLDRVMPLHAVTSKGGLDGTLALMDALQKKMSAEELR